jgi:hypothetical protein
VLCGALSDPQTARAVLKKNMYGQSTAIAVPTWNARICLYSSDSGRDLPETATNCLGRAPFDNWWLSAACRKALA